MKEYSEIKELLLSIFDCEIEVDEESDVVLYEGTNVEGEIISVELNNNQFYEAYCKCTNLHREEMQIYGENIYEVALQSEWLPAKIEKCFELQDADNDLDYIMGVPSLEYFIMLLDLMDATFIKNSRLFSSARMYLKRGFYRSEKLELINLLARVFRVRTLCIRSKKKIKLVDFQNYAHAFEYLYMYKRRQAISEVTSIESMFRFESGGLSRVNDMDQPPRRKINAELLEYYTMALEARDPFTKYISFYHIIEYHFDEVYKRKIVEQMRDKITSPDFSYKSDKKVYELAIFANKKMKNDDNNGKGNEFESLKYVLSEYVPIDELIKGLDELRPSAKTYYSEKVVSFAGSKAKIAWNDASGVYTTLAKRIYETRNSLVHSKSEQQDKQYKPQKHKEMLMKEIPLVQVIAEQIIFSTSTVV